MKKSDKNSFYDSMMNFTEGYYDNLMEQCELEIEQNSQPEREPTNIEVFLALVFFAGIIIFAIYDNIDKIKNFFLQLSNPQTYIAVLKHPIFTAFEWCLAVLFVAVNLALIFYKRRYSFGFKLIKNILISAFLTLFYIAISIIIYLASGDMKIAILSVALIFFVIFAIASFLTLKSSQNFSDSDDFLIAYLTKDGKAKTHLRITMEFFTIFFFMMLFFILQKAIHFSGGGGKFGGGGSSSKM